MIIPGIIVISCERSHRRNINKCMFADAEKHIYTRNVIGLQFKDQKSARVGPKNLVIQFEEKNPAVCNFFKDESRTDSYITVDCRPDVILISGELKSN